MVLTSKASQGLCISIFLPNIYIEQVLETTILWKKKEQSLLANQKCTPPRDRLLDIAERDNWEHVQDFQGSAFWVLMV